LLHGIFLKIIRQIKTGTIVVRIATLPNVVSLLRHIAFTPRLAHFRRGGSFIGAERIERDIAPVNLGIAIVQTAGAFIVAVAHALATQPHATGHRPGRRFVERRRMRIF
jgi:hypothetical protein